MYIMYRLRFSEVSVAVDGGRSLLRVPLRRNRDFLRLWTGGAATGLGSSLTALAYPLLALSLTDSTAEAGLLGLVAMAVGVLMRLPAGVVVDRAPLRRILVGADLLRAVATSALAVSLLTGHLTLVQLLVVAAVNAVGGAFGEIGQSVALRHVVPAAQLPQAFALDDGRRHAVGLAGQPAGGLLFAAAPVLTLVADALSSVVSAVLAATIRHPLVDPDAVPEPRGPLRHDLLTGLAFLWREPFLRATLFGAAGYQLVFTAAMFALIASMTAGGATSAELGAAFAVAAVGGLVGAVIAPRMQARLGMRSVVVMGWTATVVFAALSWIEQPLLAGFLIGCIYVTSAPANALLLAAQVDRTPGPLQGRVMAASFLIAGIAAPLGPPLSGLLLDATGPAPTFAGVAVLTAAITVAVHLSRGVRSYRRPTGEAENGDRSTPDS